MSNRRQVLKNLLVGGAAAAALPSLKLFASTGQVNIEEYDFKSNGSERAFWVELLYKMANPVLSNLAKDELKKNMIVEKAPNFDSRSIDVTYLEAVGRTMAGVAPWLALPDDDTKEGRLRKKMREDALEGISNAVDSTKADFLNFKTDYQPIVDTAYLVQSFIRAPKALWEPLSNKTKQNLVKCVKSLRNRKPFNSNWQLFGSTAEAFLMSIGEQYDKPRIFDAVKKMQSWYKGDGWYGDGPRFAFDYYNSYVIHPFMVDTLKILLDNNFATKAEYDLAYKRMVRYAEQQEKMISPEGTYPPIGRSITYRTGAFQVLAEVAWQENLPKHIDPAQVRCALTKVYKNMYVKHSPFSKEGWLLLGFCGHQPNIADYYTSTGSLYMATLSFLPLGLPADSAFWKNPAADWTAKAAWAGKEFTKDYHVDY